MGNSIFLLSVVIFLSGCISQIDPGANLYEAVCPWNDAETCEYGIAAIVPICDGTKEVQEWKKDNPAATLEHAYNLRKLTPEEMNEWYLDDDSYRDLFQLNETDEIWWVVDYAWGGIQKCEKPPCSIILEHPEFTVFVQEDSRTCVPDRGGFY